MLPANPITTVKLIPVSQFTDEQLAAIYNQTRVDYMVPMPMNAARLTEYIKTYDISREYSLVAQTHDGEMLGVNMLGLREDRAWITRLGVIPNTRRHGVGQALMVSLMEQATRLSINFVMLEVIKNNTPAHQLFLKLGFYEVGELLVLRRRRRGARARGRIASGTCGGLGGARAGPRARRQGDGAARGSRHSDRDARDPSGAPASALRGAGFRLYYAEAFKFRSRPEDDTRFCAEPGTRSKSDPQSA